MKIILNRITQFPHCDSFNNSKCKLVIADTDNHRIRDDVIFNQEGECHNITISSKDGYPDYILEYHIVHDSLIICNIDGFILTATTSKDVGLNFIYDLKITKSDKVGDFIKPINELPENYVDFDELCALPISARWKYTSSEWNALLAFHDWTDDDFIMAKGYFDNNDKQLLTQNHKYPDHFLDDYPDLIDWAQASITYDLTEDQMRKHLDEIRIYDVISHRKLSEDFIQLLLDKGLEESLYLIIHQNLSDQIIRKNKSDFIGYGRSILSMQKDNLSEEFIKEIRDGFLDND